MTELESLVRATVSDLAAESRPRDLLPGVCARARRIRTVHRTGYVAVALTAVLVVLVPYLVSRPATRVEPGPQPLSPAPSPLPSDPSPAPSGPWSAVIRLPGGWVVTGSTYLASGGEPDPHAWVLDRRTQRYVRLNYPVALPAPTGTQVLVGNLDSTAYALLDLATGAVRQLGVHAGVDHPEWSPDGKRLLFTRTLSGFELVDVATTKVTDHRIDQVNRYRCNDSCEFTWYPDSKRVVLAQTDTTVAHDEAKPDVQRGLQLFDADTGTAGQLLPVHGIVDSVRAWSPDGRYVAVKGTGPGRVLTAQVVEASTGRVAAVLPTNWWEGAQGWVDTQRLLVLTGSRLCLASLTGALGECVPWPDGAEDRSQALIGPG